MRYIYDRVGLGFKRATMVAVVYAGLMAGCAWTPQRGKTYR